MRPDLDCVRVLWILEDRGAVTPLDRDATRTLYGGGDMRRSLDGNMFICEQDCDGRYLGRAFVRVPRIRGSLKGPCHACALYSDRGISELCGHAPACGSNTGPFVETALN